MLNSIVLDPGHCAKWAGASGRVSGILESAIVLEICLIMKEYLAAHGITALLTHGTPICLDARSRALDLAARFNFAYSRKLPIFSLHCNSAADTSAYGYECYTLPGQDISDAMATAALCYYQRMFPKQHMRTDTHDGDPDKEMQLAVLGQHNGNAALRNIGVLFELPFLSNPVDETFLRGRQNYPKIAAALGEGITSWGRNIHL